MASTRWNSLLLAVLVGTAACATSGDATPTATAPLASTASTETTMELPTSSVSVPADTVASTAPPPVETFTGWLMFSRFDEATHTFISTHLIRPDGSGETELQLPGPEGGGRWSRDGSQIAVMTVLGDGRIGTAIIRPDGTVDRILETPDETLNAVCTVWSPDDSRLACEAWDDTDPSRSGIYTVQASDGSGLTRLTTAPEGFNDLPGDFSPDGSQLVFKRTTDEASAPLMTLDLVVGGDPVPLSDQAFEDAGRFSVDGASVLTSSGGDIILVDLDGNVLETIQEPSAFLFGPVWSPDGEWIAFSRGTSGPFADVFISRVDGADRWQVTETPANEIAVDWGAEPDRIGCGPVPQGTGISEGVSRA